MPLDQFNPPTTALGVRPQLIRNAPMIIVGFRADKDAIARYLPAPLRPHENGRILLNMWALQDANSTTGFGGFEPMSVTYLAAEVDGHDGVSADGTARWPGRYFLKHWVGSAAARSYALETSGLETDPEPTVVTIDDGRLVAQLEIGGRVCAKIEAQVGDTVRRVASGHSNYFAERYGADPSSGLAHLVIPWVGDVLDVDVKKVELDFPADIVPPELVPQGEVTVETVVYRRLSFVPYLTNSILTSK